MTIVQRNYLEVYIYDKWSDKEIYDYEQVEEFEPSAIDLIDGHTQPPPLLTEADLIALMDKHGIGTDATHAEHIETVKTRNYIGLQERDKLVPGVIGMALCDGYDSMGFEMSKPNLRAQLEVDLKRYYAIFEEIALNYNELFELYSICDGTKQPEEVLREQIGKYKHIFQISINQVLKLEQACAHYLQENPQNNR